MGTSRYFPQSKQVWKRPPSSTWRVRHRCQTLRRQVIRRHEAPLEPLFGDDMRTGSRRAGEAATPVLRILKPNPGAGFPAPPGCSSPGYNPCQVGLAA